MSQRVIAILGCTASGKGRLARELAPRLGGEIVSVDSMKVYRGMDIGTAKPTRAELAATPHHMIDIVDPWESFSAARFVELAEACIDAIHGRGRPAIVVGGTMLYFKSLYEGMFEGPAADADFRAALRRRAADAGAGALHEELARVDPEAAARIHRHDLRRIERALEVHALTGTPISALQREWTRGRPRRADWDWTLIGLHRPREAANRLINERVRRMMADGLLDEVRRLACDPRGLSIQARQAVGYAELLAHLAGALPLDEAVERIKVNSRRLAKQQRTWLKRLTGLRTIEVGEDDDAESVLARAMATVVAADAGQRSTHAASEPGCPPGAARP